MKKGILILSGVLGVSALTLVLLILVYVVQSEKPHANRDTNIATIEQETTQQAVKVEPVTPDAFPKWAEELKDNIIEDLLPVNPYSRPGTILTEINALVIHYVGNPGTTAAQNRSYFQNIMETHEASVSSHYVVGLDGEIIQCVPLSEVSYASNSRNTDTIAIECCHPDETGQFNDATYESVVKLAAYLCILYGLDPQTDVIRHYDITGKECPKYFVDNENQWNLFKAQIKRQMNER